MRMSSDDIPAEGEAATRPWRDSIALYNAFAADYDAAFEASHRQAYDRVAWDCVLRLLPTSPGVIVDAGCGTGRWIDRLLSLGHRVIGIEQAPEMASILQEKQYGPNFTLLTEDMETAHLDGGSADLVIAMGSLQYTKVPAGMVRRFAAWAKPGGSVCVLVDSLVALVLELIRAGKADESLARLRTRRGVFAVGDQQADVYLYDSQTLQSHFAAAGLTEISCHGMLVTSSAWGRDGCTEAMASDEAGFLDLERELASFPVMADAGKHLFVSGRRPL
jgi:SAM-dependent methyltransferase